MASYILALDQGTTSSRAIVFDRAGQIAAKAQHPFPQIYPQAGWVEHDPMTIWDTERLAAAEAIRGLPEGSIAGIGVTNQRETTIVWDKATGQPVYFDFHDMAQDDYGAIKASCCVPVVNRPYRWRGKAYYDGGLSDPIPFQQAFQAGCDRVVVILTRPKDYYRDPKKDQRMAKLLRKYPNAARVLALRAETYNRQLEQAHALAQAGKVLLVAPDDIGGMSTLTKDRGAILTMYHKGRSDAKAIGAFLAGK